MLVYSVLVCSANHWREVLLLLCEIRRLSDSGSSLKWWRRRPSNQTKETRQAVIDNGTRLGITTGFSADSKPMTFSYQSDNQTFRRSALQGSVV